MKTRINWLNVAKLFVLIASTSLIATDVYKIVVLGMSWTYLGMAVFISAVAVATNIVEQFIEISK